ncbi:hypothetical protein DPEC_G00206400 [Dallia pectoralis]|uniref:Uncharacterized protein n=1 Tax=Dallia pectoralis TaxID=75939 RepID=A0ACC2G4V5_DALPE|nr:hypothetical protein DPEC_G00206400 [Dallia pectoralis]
MQRTGGVRDSEKKRMTNGPGETRGVKDTKGKREHDMKGATERETDNGCQREARGHRPLDTLTTKQSPLSSTPRRTTHASMLTNKNKLKHLSYVDG